MNPEGTPNPLNPVQGVKPVEEAPGMATGTGMPEQTAKPSSSASFTRPVGTPSGFSRPVNPPEGFSRPAGSIDGFARPNGTAGAYNHPTSVDGFSQPSQRATHAAVDPMMRPSHHNEQEDPYDSFESLDSANGPTIGMTQTSTLNAPSMAEPELTAKDSIVESAGGKRSKKRPLIIGAIILVIVAVICGAAAVVLAVMNNSGDKVAKAVEKLISGQVSNLVSVDGNISVVPNSDEGSAQLSSANIKFNGSFDTASSLNKVTATINGSLPTGGEMTLDVSELTNKNGETFFKISGLDTILNALNFAPQAVDAETVEVDLGDSVESVTATDCVDDGTETDCITPDAIIGPEGPVSLTATSGLLTVYSGLLSAVNDQWILVSDEFETGAGDLDIFDNPTTCLINAFGTLTSNSSSVAKEYKQNPFVTYSTDKMTISKKKNDLYRLGFDEAKLKTFANNLEEDGLLESLDNCSGNTSSNFSLEKLLGDSTIYAEVDDDFNFTRFYFENDNTELDNTGAATVTADLNLTYPSELKIVEPESYIDMSTLLGDVMTKILSGSDTPATDE